MWQPDLTPQAQKTDTSDVWRFWSGELFELYPDSANTIDSMIVRAYRNWMDLSLPDTVELPIAAEYSISKISVELVLDESERLLKAWFESSGETVVECDYRLETILLLKASPVKMRKRTYYAYSKKDEVTVETIISKNQKEIKKYKGRDKSGFLNGIEQKYQTPASQLTADEKGKILGDLAKVKELRTKFDELIQCLLDNKQLEKDGLIVEKLKNTTYDWDFRKCKDFKECTVILDKMFNRPANEILASNWKIPDCKKPGSGKPQGGQSNNGGGKKDKGKNK